MEMYSNSDDFSTTACLIAVSTVTVMIRSDAGCFHSEPSSKEKQEVPFRMAESKIELDLSGAMLSLCVLLHISSIHFLMHVYNFLTNHKFAHECPTPLHYFWLTSSLNRGIRYKSTHYILYHKAAGNDEDLRMFYPF